jgi:hypothetical protein
MEATGIAVGEMEIIRLNTGQKTTYRIDEQSSKSRRQSQSTGVTNANPGSRLNLVDMTAHRD